MGELVLKLNKPYVGKMQKLLKVIGNNDLFVDKFWEYHINRLKREIVRMQLSLEKYEKKYGMKTDVFYKLFDNGELGDDKDYMLWAGIYEFQMDSKQKLSQLI
ncbi:MAG: hypothetical protein DRI95_06250 [Bacteroidetes bacterium]|nr:MAG: hypothetical protein DRI95_06250 [Bacteroidota bacterium]